MIRRIVQTLAAASMLATLGCSTTHSTRVNFLGKRVDAEHPPTVLGLPLHTGQLVLTEAVGSYSYMFLLIPKQFYPFTHAAILAMEADGPVVYNISGEYNIGFHDKVMDGVEGGMRREPFFQYVSNNLYAEVVEPPPGVDGEKVAAFARQKMKEGVKFDAYFRFDEHEKLYCTELVQLALEAGGDKPRALAEVTDNPTILESMKWLGVQQGSATIPPIFFHSPDRVAASLGRFPTRTAAYAYFEAKRELHRRFTKDQRIGFLFDMKWTGDIEVHPEIEAFTYDAAKLFDDEETPPPPGDPRIAQAVRQLAADRFGPFEP
ncbi:MAG: hypothetical protein U0359_15010 [Byssovorax sp.]